MNKTATPFSCPQCRIGVCRPGRTTYLRMVTGQLLSVPNMPVYTCDVCGYREFEREAMLRLQAMVGEIATPAEETTPRAKAQPFDILDSSELKMTRRLKP